MDGRLPSDVIDDPSRVRRQFALDMPAPVRIRCAQDEIAPSKLLVAELIDRLAVPPVLEGDETVGGPGGIELRLADEDRLLQIELELHEPRPVAAWDVGRSFHRRRQQLNE